MFTRGNASVFNGNEHSSILLPEQSNYEIAYGLSLKIATEKLASLQDLTAQCLKSGAVFNKSDNSISLDYLNKKIRISLPDIHIDYNDTNKPVEIKDQILILHYLLHSKGTSSETKLIAFQEFSEGANYYPSYFKRSIQPLMQHFGTCPEKILELSKDLGGRKSNYGDASVAIPAFPKISLTYVLWRGDDEFPPNANILFDNTILDYLPAEDTIVLCQTITWKLVHSLLSQNTLS
jgi:hypothetical protein